MYAVSLIIVSATLVSGNVDRERKRHKERGRERERERQKERERERYCSQGTCVRDYAMAPTW